MSAEREVYLADCLRDCVATGMLDFERAIHLANAAHWLESIEGDIVEMGCHKGSTGKLLAAITGRQVWLYDSFDGLPEPSPMDEGRREDFQKGGLKCDAADVAFTWMSGDSNFEPKPPIIFSGWFDDLTPEDLPQSIALAHIDCDFHSSILSALNWVYPRLSLQAYCFIDDYGAEMLPGVKRAVDTFMFGKDEMVRKTAPNQALFMKGEVAWKEEKR